MEECTICLQDERDNRPMVLPCGHTFCVRCCERVKPKCPTCRASFQNEAVNFAILDHIEELRRPTASHQESSPEVTESLLRDLEMVNIMTDMENAQLRKEQEELEMAIAMSREDEDMKRAIAESARMYQMEQSAQIPGQRSESPVFERPAVARVSHNSGPTENFGSSTLYVKNFGETYDEDTLRILFSRCGHVESCTVPLNEQGKPRGFGYVVFSNLKHAQKAKQTLHGQSIGRAGRKLYVDFYKSKEERALMKR